MIGGAFRRKFSVLPLLISLATIAGAQSFRVQCPSSTITHPDPNGTGVNNSEPAYTAPTYTGNQVYGQATGPVNGAIKCQQISGGDGFATMGDGTQTYMFSFGPLSGLADIANGGPGTKPPSIFNTPSGASGLPTDPQHLQPGDPATTAGASDGNYSPGDMTKFAFNGAVGLIGDPETDPYPTPGGVQALGTAAITTAGIVGSVTVTNPGSGYFGPVTATFTGGCTTGCQTAIGEVSLSKQGKVTGVTITFAGVGYTSPPTVTFSFPVTSCVQSTTKPCLNGHVDPRPIIDVGVMNGNIPAPMMAIDEDDEFFLTLSNVGMIMRPDLFEQHTVHFHGYPNASSFYDGVPDASVAINIGGSFTYYYLAPDAGTYFWHCHITPPEHLQMGMVGQLYVRPRQNRVPTGTDLGVALKAQQGDLRTACNPASDIVCTNPMPATANPTTGATGVPQIAGGKYAYNDGDGSTRYDVEYPLQIHGFDPNFHFVGMTFNPEGFTDMKDKYFLLNGRSYPDTVTAGPMATQSTDGVMHYSQPLPAIITIPAGKIALLRISDLDVTEYQTLASLGIPMKVIGYNAKLLRDQEGNNLYYTTNSITLAGGESLDVLLDTTNIPNGTYYLYTPNLDHLSNDAENFGGLMTEVRVN